MQFYKKDDDGNFVEAKLWRAFNDQSDFDEAVKDRVDRERRQFADYDEIKSSVSTLNEKLKTQETEKKGLEEQLKSKDKEIENEKLNVARVDIRHEFGLSKDIEKFLVGSNEDEIRENAELLKKSGGSGTIEFDKKTETGPVDGPSKVAATALFGQSQE